MFSFIGGGSGGYPGVTSDNANGLIITGKVVALDGVQEISELYAASPLSIPSGIETNVGPYTGVIARNPPFHNAPVGGVNNMGFRVPISGTYRHLFSIPITAGTTGGDIEVRAIQDAGIIETWVFTVLAGVKVVLNGQQADQFDPINVNWYSLFQSTGSAWNINGQSILDIKLL